MVFEDLEVFISVLLGKQVSRMISEPDTLWVKMLKGLYFHNKIVLEAGK